MHSHWCEQHLLRIVTRLQVKIAGLELWILISRVGLTNHSIIRRISRSIWRRHKTNPISEHFSSGSVEFESPQQRYTDRRGTSLCFDLTDTCPVCMDKFNPLAFSLHTAYADVLVLWLCSGRAADDGSWFNYSVRPLVEIYAYSAFYDDRGHAPVVRIIGLSTVVDEYRKRNVTVYCVLRYEDGSAQFVLSKPDDIGVGWTMDGHFLREYIYGCPLPTGLNNSAAVVSNITNVVG